jgi:hypothetical protein
MRSNRQGAEIEVESDMVRLKIWGRQIDEFVMLSLTQAWHLRRQLDAAITEVEGKPSARRS